MAGIFGSLSINDNDRVFNATTGQRAIYDVAAAWVAERNAALDAALALFVGETTDEYSRRYKLPGGGYLQRRGSQGRPVAVKASGSWDVAFPLEDFAAQMAWNDVDMAYMTVRELENHLNTVWVQNQNTVRFELIKALVNNTADTFSDPLHGDLTIQPLANGDTVVYPPVLGASAEATDDHYLESGYLYTAISDVNDPYETMAGELEEHFDAPTGGGAIAVFQPASVTPYTTQLTNFVSVAKMGIQYGSTTDLAGPIPAELMSIGRVLGKMEDSGVWVVEWRYLPTAATPYLVGLHLNAAKPLVKRIDPADTGLGEGLQLVADDSEMPFSAAFWRHRLGFGVGNRLNGVVLEMAAGGTFTIPTDYD